MPVGDRGLEGDAAWGVEDMLDIPAVPFLVLSDCDLT